MKELANVTKQKYRLEGFNTFLNYTKVDLEPILDVIFEGEEGKEIVEDYKKLLNNSLGVKHYAFLNLLATLNLDAFNKLVAYFIAHP